jgi:cytochrome c oxidase subunit II
MIELPFTPPQASDVAGTVDLLTLALVGFGGFFSVLVFALILIFAIRYRRSAVVDRSDPPTTSLKVELSWVVLLLFLGMSVYVGAALVFFNMSRVPAEAHEIYVLGRQWMWEIQHPEGPREINTLTVPIGVPIRLIMTSEDVIHSFFVPAFRLKYDVIPGRYTNLSFTATQTGEFHLFCAEYCGTDHSDMIGTVVVLEQRQFQDWLAENIEGTVSMPDAGRQVYERMGCASCHDPDTGIRAPSLAGRFGGESVLEDGNTVEFEENYIRESILRPMDKITAGYDRIMPTYQGQMTEEEIQLIIEFIKSLSAHKPGHTVAIELPLEIERYQPTQ